MRNIGKVPVRLHLLHHQSPQPPRAIPKPLQPHVHAVEHFEVEVADGRVAPVTDVASGGEGGACLAGEENGQVVVVVAVAVAVARAVEDHAVVEERASPSRMFLRRSMRYANCSMWKVLMRL